MHSLGVFPTPPASRSPTPDPLLAQLAALFLDLNAASPPLAPLYAHPLPRERLLANHSAFLAHCLHGDPCNYARMRSAHKRLFSLHRDQFAVIVGNLVKAVRSLDADSDTLKAVMLNAMALESWMVDEGESVGASQGRAGLQRSQSLKESTRRTPLSRTRSLKDRGGTDETESRRKWWNPFGGATVTEE